jgi:hypothetical protein
MPQPGTAVGDLRGSLRKLEIPQKIRPLARRPEASNLTSGMGFLHAHDLVLFSLCLFIDLADVGISEFLDLFETVALVIF